MLRGYDIDGVLSVGVQPEHPYVVLSGRTFPEYDAFCKELASNAPVYIRGIGKYGDVVAAGQFKALMINALKITEFHEDDLVQAEIIGNLCPNTTLVMH